jgi:hypothetical protein
MKITRRAWILAALVAVVLAAASAAQAAETVLDLIPGDALGFVVVNHIGQTDAKIRTLSEQIRVPVFGGGPLAAAKLMTHVGDGVLDDKRAAAIAAVPAAHSGDHPEPIVLVPVIDYEAMLKSLGGENSEPEKVTDAISRVTVADGASKALVAEKDGYAIFVEVANQKLLEAVLAGKKSVSTQVAPWREWIDGSDAVVVITEPAVKMLAKRGGDELDKAKAMFETMGEQGAQVVAAFGMYQNLLHFMGEELTAVGIGVTIEKDGSLRLSSQGMLTPDGKMAEWIKNVEAPSTNLWAGIPNKPYALALGGTLPEPLVKALMDVSVDMMRLGPNIYGLDEAQTKKLAEISAKSMKDVQGMSFAIGPFDSGKSIYQGMYGAMRVGDSKAFMDRYADVIKAMAELSTDAKNSPLSSMATKPVEVAGHAAIEVTMDLSGMFDNPALAAQGPMLKAMYGPEGKMTVYLAAANEHAVVFAYDDAQGLEAALKAVESDASLSADPGVAAMAKRLPKGAQWCGYWSPQGTVKVVEAIIQKLSPAGNDFKLPEFPKTPPVAFAAKASGNTVYKELLIPVEILKEAQPYFMRLREVGPTVQ